MSSNKNMAHNRHTVRRAAALERIAQIGPFLEGSLCSFNRPGCKRPGWHLTFKQKAKTRTVYVPIDAAARAAGADQVAAALLAAPGVP